MKVSEILKKNEVTISCEILPPKQGAQLQNYKAIAAEIAKDINSGGQDIPNNYWGNL